MIDRVDVKECCQCGNCAINCPVGAISFSRENGLFLFPSIDLNKCIHCNKCEKTCPVISPLEQTEVIESYATKNKDTTIKKQSSSGGVFSALAETVFFNGGAVYGAVFEKDFCVKHKKAGTAEDLIKMRGSKYVLSDLNNCFFEIKQLLCSNITVLFSGTPCQCAALQTFLKDTSYGGTLYVVDFVCHGILSDKLFHEYIRSLEIKRKSKIVSFEFRNKKYGWIDSGPLIKYQNGQEDHWPLYEDTYMQGYFQGICMRESCYRCQYKNFRSGSDLTMGDYWGAKQLSPELYDSDGLSMLVVNSDNGKNLLELAKNKLILSVLSVETLSKYNQGLYRPFKKGEKSEQFYQLLERTDAITALKKVTEISHVEKMKRVYRKVRRIILWKMNK